MKSFTINQVVNGFTMSVSADGNADDDFDYGTTEIFVATSPQELVQLFAAKLGCPLPGHI